MRDLLSAMSIQPGRERWSPGDSRLVNRRPFSTPYHDFRTSTRNPIHHNVNPSRSGRVDFPVRRARNCDFIVGGDRVNKVDEARVGVNAMSDETEVHE
jgi:hypothetical protein